MKLNHDCIRYVLLYLEDNLTVNDYYSSLDIPVTPDFSSDDILYSLSKLDEAGYIQTKTFKSLNNTELLVISITWHGHEFLDSVRDSKVWSAVKSTTSNLASVPLKMIPPLAIAYISKQLGI